MSGTRQVAHTQMLLSRWDGGGHVQVGVTRDATLTEDLTQLESRRVRSIRLIIGNDDLNLTVGQARLVSEGLLLALDSAWQEPLGSGLDANEEER